VNGKRTRNENDTRLAALVFLSRSFDWSSIIRIAEDWIRPVDLPWFVKETEKHARAFAGFIEDCLENHAKELQGEAGEETAWFLKCELDGVRKNLAFIGRIGKTVAETDGKSTTAVAAPGSETDFAAEAEELRKLRAGDLKVDPPPDSKGLQQ